MANEHTVALESINNKLDAIIKALGLSVDDPTAARVKAEAAARKHWSPGGAGYEQMYGNPKAVEKTQAERQAALDAAATAEAEAAAAREALAPDAHPGSDTPVDTATVEAQEEDAGNGEPKGKATSTGVKGAAASKGKE